MLVPGSGLSNINKNSFNVTKKGKLFSTDGKTVTPNTVRRDACDLRERIFHISFITI